MSFPFAYIPQILLPVFVVLELSMLAMNNIYRRGAPSTLALAQLSKPAKGLEI
jgi:hypothetical protein